MTNIDELRVINISIFLPRGNRTKICRVFQAAEKGAEATRDMKARAGRASYVSTSLVQQPDPGAVGVVTWLRAAYNAYLAATSSS